MGQLRHYQHTGQDTAFGMVASLLVSSTLDLAVRVQAGDIVLCSKVRHFTLTVPLST